MKTLLIADHAVDAFRLERLLHLAWGYAQVSVHLNREGGEPGTPTRAAEADALMIDPGATGLDWLEHAPWASASAVVVADDPSLALRAFELGVGDFLLKPVLPSRLTQALRRVLGAGRRSDAKPAHLALRKAGGIELIPFEELLYVRGADNYTEIVLNDGRRELHDETLATLSLRLWRDFERVHKSYLARVDAMRRLAPRHGNHYAIELSSGDVLPVGRTYYRAVRERLVGPERGMAAAAEPRPEPCVRLSS